MRVSEVMNEIYPNFHVTVISSRGDAEERLERLWEVRTS